MFPGQNDNSPMVVSADSAYNMLGDGYNSQVKQEQLILQNSLQISDITGADINRQFLGAITSMYNEQKEEIYRKRKMQEELAESLRLQIEEKRKIQNMNKSIRNPHTYESISQQASSIMRELNLNKTIGNSYNRDPILVSHSTKHLSPLSNVKSYSSDRKIQSLAPNIMLQSRNTDKIHNHMNTNLHYNGARLVNFRDTFCTDLNTISIPSESPFSNTDVSTPPLGFSIRKDVTKKRNIDPKFNKIHMNLMRPQYHPNINNYIATFPNEPEFYEAKHVQTYGAPYRDESDWAVQRLGTASELVYPDGHVSSPSTPY